MTMDNPAFWLAAVQIIWINILLSGDNAVVIALACRTLEPRQRFWGMILGAGVAVLLRIAFTGVVTQLMNFPYLKLVGGIALLWIAVKLIVPEESHGEGKIEAADNLWRAVRIVAIADVVMSLDNVIAIAAAAKGSWVLIIFGLAISIPMIIAGAALLMAILERFPVLVWAGAALLGWIAGEIMIEDPAVVGWLGAETVHRFVYWAATAGAALLSEWASSSLEVAANPRRRDAELCFPFPAGRGERTGRHAPRPTGSAPAVLHLRLYQGVRSTAR
jgi:YjbE family integral membrane protein